MLLRRFALVISPENLIPPSAMIGPRPEFLAAREHSMIAVICGTPAPVTNSGGTDRAGTRCQLSSRRQPAKIRSQATFCSCDITGNQLNIREICASRLRIASITRGGMPMGGVDCEYVNLLPAQVLQARLREIVTGSPPIAGNPPRKAALVRPFAGARKFDFLLNIFYGDQAFEVEFVCLRPEAFRIRLLLKKSARLHRAWCPLPRWTRLILRPLRRLQGSDRGFSLESKIPVGQNPHQPHSRA